MVAIAVTGAVSSCSHAGRHKALTILFTGVPPLEEEGSEAEDSDSDEISAAPAAGQEEAPENRRVSPFWVHRPYRARECTKCHLVGSVGRESDASGPIRRGGPPSVGLEMTAPEDELCATCHTTKTEGFAESRGLEIHMPVAAGLCTECHHPHQSRRRYMLLGNDNTALCAECHEPHDLQRMDTESEEPGVGCVSCHNPHLGKTPLMLRSEFSERVDNLTEQ